MKQKRYKKIIRYDREWEDWAMVLVSLIVLSGFTIAASIWGDIRTVWIGIFYGAIFTCLIGVIIKIISYRKVYWEEIK